MLVRLLALAACLMAVTANSFNVSVAAGHGDARTSAAQSSAASAELQGRWLPLKQKGGKIVAIGSYCLPDALTMPKGVRPLDLADIFIEPMQARVPTTATDRKHIFIQIFFPPADEGLVYRVASTYSTIIKSKSFHRRSIGCNFLVRPDPSRQPYFNILPRKPVPAHPPYCWQFHVSGWTSKAFYGAYWKGVASDADTSTLSEATPDVFSSDSPVKRHPRFVSLSVIIEPTPSPLSNRNSPHHSGRIEGTSVD